MTDLPQDALREAIAWLSDYARGPAGSMPEADYIAMFTRDAAHMRGKLDALADAHLTAIARAEQAERDLAELQRIARDAMSYIDDDTKNLRAAIAANNQEPQA